MAWATGMCRIIPTARMNVPCFLGRDTFNLDRQLERGLCCLTTLKAP